MKLVDVHCHLSFDRFADDLSEVVLRAQQAGVGMMVSSGVNPKTNREVLTLAKKYSGVIVPSFGVYPVDAVAHLITTVEDDVLRDIESFDVDAELAWIEDHKDDMIAIGEVGLDYKMVVDEPARALQRDIFRKIIALAKRIDKPLIIHSRNAEADVVKILEEEKFNRVIMHCFSGRKHIIKKAVELGVYCSVPPVITRLEHFKMLVEVVPLSQLLTETDAPYLSPVAGERNEPANIPLTIKEIAKIKGLSSEVVAEAIFNNVKSILKL